MRCLSGFGFENEPQNTVLISNFPNSGGQSRTKPKRETPEILANREFLYIIDILSLGELGSATCGLQTVLLLLANPKTLVYQGFSASLS